MIIEPDLNVIGKIVDGYGDKSSEAWSRYHETARGALKMSFWADHFEWKFLAARYRPCTVLDYGCGTGHSDIYLADAGFSVIGYEPNMTNYAVAEYIVSLQDFLIRRNVVMVDRVPNKDWSDLIQLTWISHVLEHVPKEAWRKFFRPIIQSKWKTLISVPLGHAHEVPSHVNFWGNEYEIVTDLESIGLVVGWSGTDYENNVIRVEIIHG